MARTRHRRDEQDATRIVDPRQHFLGLMKGGEAYFYCAKCKRFLLVTDQDTDHQPAKSRSDSGTRERGVGPGSIEGQRPEASVKLCA